MQDGAGTGGGRMVTSGGQYRVAVALAIGFIVIATALTVGNAMSAISNMAAAGLAETTRHIWVWEITSVSAWLTVLPAIWTVSLRLCARNTRWPAIVLTGVLGLPLASAWHIGLMIVMRHAIYATGGETYTFRGKIAEPYLYEFRKDVATYLQFVAAVILSQWLLHRPTLVSDRPSTPINTSSFLTIVDGAVRHRLPMDEIDHVSAAGNYVEVASRGRTLLHRTTLATVEKELGDGFVRVHRSRLVRLSAIRSIQSDRSGDFTVVMQDGVELRGSRRYRNGLIDARG